MLTGLRPTVLVLTPRFYGDRVCTDPERMPHTGGRTP